MCWNCLSYNVWSGKRPTRVQVNAWYREVHRCCRQCHRTLERTVAFCLQVVIACVVAHHPDLSACQHISMSACQHVLDRLHPFKCNFCSGRCLVLVSTSPQCTGCAHSWREGNPPRFRWWKSNNRNADTFLISFHRILIINLFVLKALLIGASARAIAAFSMIPITVLKTR